MEVNEENIGRVVSTLQKTLSADPQKRLPAEENLKLLEDDDDNFPMILLGILSTEDVDINVKIAAAVMFKNFVKKRWNVENSSSKTHQFDKESIKSTVLDLLSKSPPSIQNQLRAAIVFAQFCKV